MFSPASFRFDLVWSPLPCISVSRSPVTLPSASLALPCTSWILFFALSVALMPTLPSRILLGLVPSSVIGLPGASRSEPGHMSGRCFGDDRYMLGLPDDVTACLFDLDGVLTDTASVHRAAWKETFDPYLAAHGEAPFSTDDYDSYVDGKPRADGVRDFLASRGIHPPEGLSSDPPDQDTIHGIGNRKAALLIERITRDGVKVYDGSRRYLALAREAGLARAVVSSSTNTVTVLQTTGLDEFVQAVVD